MPSQLAILAAAAVATAGGGVPGANACVNRRSIPHLHTPCSPNHHINEQVAAATKNAQATVAVTMPAVAIDDEEESDEMANDERPMHEDQDGVWYGRVRGCYGDFSFRPSRKTDHTTQ